MNSTEDDVVTIALENLLTEMTGYASSRFNFHLMTQQSITGVGFNVEKATALLSQIERDKEIIASDVEPNLPPRPLKKGEEKDYTVPAKPYKKDGTLSATGLRFIERHNISVEDGFITWNGERVKLEGGLLLSATAKMTLSNQEDIKNYLISEGWEPTLWNVKRDDRGKPVRDAAGKVIYTSPKMQENGRLCPNLEKLDGDLARKIVRWLSLSNREAILKGWIGHPRTTDTDEPTLPAGSVGMTNTHRQKHTTVNA